ncbi:methyltransferase domain-containing protein [Cellulomonas sp. URHB0016]
MMLDSTPVRDLGVLDAHGCRVLSDPGLTYADGAEAKLAEIVGRATDLSSSSQELADEASDWATEYSLTTTRANLLRGLDLPADARVLEIGAGCGPITRYLGETCALVDAVEPMAARARVARLRTRDLDHVAVMVGMLEDVPLEPTYDVVVVIGVLEYVANGAEDPTPYTDFLRRVHGLLRPNGSLVLAIENQVGVKYLVGAPEDHSDRAFDSIEGYPLPSPARTFTRERLTSMLAQTGFQPRTLGVFPDYKLPRVLMDDALYALDRGLARRLPPMPSRDYQTPRLSLADERLTWATLVDTGVGENFANSFVMVADRGAPSSLWPADRLAVAMTATRQPRFGVRAEVVHTEGGIRFRRTPIARGTHGGDPGVDGVQHVVEADAPHVLGDTLLELLARHPDEAGALLKRWTDLVPDAERNPVDLVPHNIIVQADGEPTVIDQEWHIQGYGRENHLVRGLYWTAVEIARTSEAEAWGGAAATVRDLVTQLGTSIGLAVDDDALERFIAVESDFQAAVNTSDPGLAARKERAAGTLRAALNTHLADFGRHRGLVADVAALTATAHRLSGAESEMERLHVRLALQEAELAQLRRQRDASVERRARRMAGKVARGLKLR